MKKKTLYNLIMVAIIVAIVAGGVFGVGYIRGWFDRTDGGLILQNIVGVVRMERAGVNYTVDGDTVLRPGDMIAAQKGATAVIAMGNNRITLGGGAEVTITDVEKAEVHLTAGELFVHTEDSVHITFDAENTNLDAGFGVQLSAGNGQGSNVVQLAVTNATVAISYRMGAQTVSVFRGSLDDLSAGQQKEYVGGKTSISDIKVDSLNSFVIAQIRKANKDVSLCVTNQELDELEEKRRQELEDMINGSTEPTEPPHVHDFEIFIKAATCTEGGYTEYKCSCGESYRDSEVAAKEHSFGPWQVKKEATEQEAGSMEHACSNCGVTEQKTIDKLVHTHRYMVEVVKPTCTEKGYTLHICACGHQYTDNEVASTGHHHEIQVIAPTCTTQGYTLHICACGNRYVDKIQFSTGHDWSEWTVTKEATTEEKGQMERICQSCKAEEQKEIEKLVHTHSYTVEVVAPTCTEKGYTIHTCACGDSYRDSEVAAKGHSFGPWQVKKEATEQEEGLMERTCRHCDTGEEKTIKKLVHTHSYREEVVAPTCTEKGYTLHICACGNQYTDQEVAAKGHSYETQVVAPTCMTRGYTLHVCACGDRYTDQTKPSTGHKWGSWEEKEDGWEERTCETCGATERKVLGSEETEPPHVHDFEISIKAATCTEGGYTEYKCSCGESYRDSEVAAKGHSFGPWQVKKEATADENGLMEHACTHCGVTEQKIIEKLVHTHSYREEVVAPTCTEKGYTLHICACGNRYTDQEVAAKGHSYETQVVAPTCTAQGYTVHICSCGDRYTDSIQPAAGHNWSDWTVTKEATTEEKGQMERICQSCKAEEQKEIEKLVHTHSYTVEVVAPTCTEKGYTIHTCACGDSYRDSEVAAKGHSFGPWQVKKEATEQEEGLMERTCRHCDTGEQKIIEKLVHTHSYREEVVAPTCTEKGYTLHICACGNQYTDQEVTAKGHSYETQVVAPTCTTQGYTLHVCACGDRYTDQAKPSTGHKWGDWKTTKEPTENEEGIKVHICISCGKKEDASIPSTSKDKKYVYITILCNTILDNMSDLTPGKEEFVPEDGVILPMVKVEFTEGETVFEVLQRICKRQSIQMEYSWTPLYGSYYIEGINNLYEFDCGHQSGWMYKVNGWFPNYGVSLYELSEGDQIVFAYTCKGLGTDVGAPEWEGE